MALDVEPEHTYRWIDSAEPTHPSLIDTRHVTGELFGFVNIPMAVWIDEDGTIVRNAESASIERNPLRDVEITDGLDERTTRILTVVKAIPDHSSEYRAAIVDWATNGARSQFALSRDEVVERSRPFGEHQARATACFELGQHLRRSVGEDAAVPWWREAHRLDPLNWTYKRQAWTLASTPEGADENDLLQEPTDVYEGSWLNDVIASGGGATYTIEPQL